MSLNPLSKYKNSIEFKLTFWYATIFILSWFILFTAGYTLLEKSILSKDRQIIQGLLDNYVLVAKAKGVPQFISSLKQETLAHITGGRFVLVTSPAKEILYLTRPYGWPELNSKTIFDVLEFKPHGWVYLATNHYYNLNDPIPRDDELEITGRKLPDGTMLWLGHSAESREEYLESLRDNFFLIMLLVVLGSVFIGAFMAWRSMAPVRALTRTMVRVRSGRIDARLPLTDKESELAGLAEQFNLMLDRIQDLISGMREALDNVAHDLRTPLTRMRISIERGVLDDDPNQLKEALFDCAEESSRISRMLTTLMDISEAETGVMELKKSSIPLDQLLEEVTDIYQYAAEEKSINLVIDCPLGLSMTADPDRLRQVLCNLMDNSVKYSPDESKILIQAEAKKNIVEICIKDQGIGIAPKDVPRIFERLYRSDHSRTTKGSGLGLALVKAVVQAHQGNIRVDSTPGEGTVFTLTLPESS